MRQTISVKFFARTSRANEEGKAPIHMRIQIGIQRLDLHTKIYVSPEDWSSQGGIIKSNGNDAKRINKQLEGFKLKAFDYQRELMTEGKEVNMDNIKAKWYGTSLERPRMLMDVFKQHNEQMKALVNSEFSPLTLERYETSFRHTQAYMKWKFKVDDMDIKKLNYDIHL
ncbi:MAG: Arm DNA-binding domain-containing protein [Cytophagales bacterium]|nr:Arm DNA-binding domain-containing protein [Cytophagales bacterium]